MPSLPPSWLSFPPQEPVYPKYTPEEEKEAAGGKDIKREFASVGMVN
jgi:hypothetical protein